MLRTPPILNLPELRIASGARLALDLAQVVSESTLGVRISNSRDPKSRVSRKESGAYAVPIAIRPMATAVKGRGSIGSHSNYRAAFALQCLVRNGRTRWNRLWLYRSCTASFAPKLSNKVICARKQLLDH